MDCGLTIMLTPRGIYGSHPWMVSSSLCLMTTWLWNKLCANTPTALTLAEEYASTSPNNSCSERITDISQLRYKTLDWSTSWQRATCSLRSSQAWHYSSPAILSSCWIRRWLSYVICTAIYWNPQAIYPFYVSRKASDDSPKVSCIQGDSCEGQPFKERSHTNLRKRRNFHHHHYRVNGSRINGSHEWWADERSQRNNPRQKRTYGKGGSWWGGWDKWGYGN